MNGFCFLRQMCGARSEKKKSLSHGTDSGIIVPDSSAEPAVTLADTVVPPG